MGVFVQLALLRTTGGCSCDTVSFQSLVLFPYIGERGDNKSSKMYDIVLWFGEVIAAFLAIMMLVFVTLLCMARSRAYTSEVQATNVALVPSPTDSGRLSGLNLKNLSSDLAAVINWFLLGINLGLPKHELSKIQQRYASQGNDQQRLEMLYLWLQRTPNATWEDVVRALQQMGENRVADNIREKYIRGRSKLGHSKLITCFSSPPQVKVHAGGRFRKY